MRIPETLARSIVYLLLLPPIGLMLWQSATWAKYESMGPLCWDASIFLAMGQAMLNGLQPYIDIYENKPPGIFIISMASLYLFDSHLLGIILQVSILFWLPFLLGWFAWQQSHGIAQHTYRIFLTVAACLYGSVLAIHTLDKSGQYETESFGVLFGVLYLAVAIMSKRMGAGQILLASLMLLASVGIKEPFLLTALAGMLIYFNDTPGELRQRFLKPLILAIITGIACLSLMGILKAYFGLYFMDTFPNVVHGSKTGSVVWTTRNWWSALDSIHTHLGDHIWSLPYLIGVVLALTIGESVRDILRRNGKSWWRLIILSLAVFLSVYTVTLRDYVYDHHFAFLVPLYAGIGLRLIRMLATPPPAMNAYIMATVLLLLSSLCAGVATGIAHTPWMYNYDREQLARGAAVARTIDKVLNRCGIDRFFAIGGIDRAHPIAFTRHSPMGPLPIQMKHYLKKHVIRREKFLSGLKSSQIVVYNSQTSPWLYDLQPAVDSILESEFTRTPPDCAKNIRLDPASAYRFYFHKNM